MELPVYMITGFLESGKTSFILDTISDKQFTKGQRTLIIACEEGEVEYPQDILKAAKADVEFIEDEDDFNVEHLTELVKKYRPTQIILEYNGMWSLRTIPQKAPKDWIFYQIFMFVDHSKYQVYMNNMRQLLSDNFSIADIVVFNRCEKDAVDKKTLRRSIKALNPRIDMMFEYNDGSIEQGFQGDDEMPYDLNADPIDVVHDDFGLWYVDVMSSTDRYLGKNVRVRGMVYRASNVPKGYFVISRRAMTCCADDIQVVGILVKSPEEGKFKDGDWVEVTGKIITERQSAYKGEGPVLAAASVQTTAAAPSELVYFN
ncbi:MAG: TIGR03943 family putative permease subunit [Oscillospiraceae bacterium]